MAFETSSTVYYLARQAGFNRIDILPDADVLLLRDMGSPGTIFLKLADNPEQIAPGKALREIGIDPVFSLEPSARRDVSAQIAGIVDPSIFLSGLQRFSEENHYPPSVTGSLCSLHNPDQKFPGAATTTTDYSLAIDHIKEGMGRKLGLGLRRLTAFYGEQFEVSFEELKAMDNSMGGSRLKSRLEGESWYLGIGLATQLHRLLCTLAVSIEPSLQLALPQTFRSFTRRDGAAPL